MQTSLSRLPHWRRENNYDFVVENPLYGDLWQLDIYRNLLRHDGSNAPLSKNAQTSYCHYGFTYNKPTNFFTSLINFNPVAPCPRNCCERLLQGNPTHLSQVRDANVREKNSVPERLTNEAIDAWLDKLKVRPRGGESPPPIEHKLFVDAFAGFGSVADAVRGRAGDDIFVVENDLSSARNGMRFDISRPGQLELLLDTCMVALRQSRGAGIRIENVAFLIWFSTPCETYSTEGRAAHRGSGARLDVDISRKAASHDAMNKLIARWIEKNVFCKPSGAPGPSAA